MPGKLSRVYRELVPSKCSKAGPFYQKTLILVVANGVSRHSSAEFVAPHTEWCVAADDDSMQQILIVYVKRRIVIPLSCCLA